MKTYFSVLLVVVSTMVCSQTNWGIRGGVNINTISNASAGNDSYDNLQSFHAGLMSNISFLAFSFQPSVLVTGKGSRATIGDPNGSGNYFVAEVNPIYIQVPATFNFNPHFGEFSGLYIGAGPYVAMGVGGKNRTHGRSGGAEFSSSSSIEYVTEKPKVSELDHGAAYSTLRRFDYGATINAGVFLTRIHIGVFYDQGLTKFNVVSNAGQSDNMRLRTMGFTAGFVFGG